ncbi:MAG: hypothetical protein HY243_07165 [Proteobacteria bacterium]|nr:hypothetical protein [Pseudomonadota bacterium]
MNLLCALLLLLGLGAPALTAPNAQLTTVLLEGAMPLSLLEARIERWIAEQGG